MSDLVEWLRACIAEDEERINYIPDLTVVLNSHGDVSARGEGWFEIDDCDLCGKHFFDGSEDVVEQSWWEHRDEAHHRAHVLAVCKAHREIVDWVIVNAVDVDNEWGDGCTAEQIRAGECHDRQTATALEPLRALALAYADRPGFREDWRPTC